MGQGRARHHGDSLLPDRRCGLSPEARIGSLPHDIAGRMSPGREEGSHGDHGRSYPAAPTMDRRRPLVKMLMGSLARGTPLQTPVLYNGEDVMHGRGGRTMTWRLGLLIVGGVLLCGALGWAESRALGPGHRPRLSAPPHHPAALATPCGALLPAAARQVPAGAAISMSCSRPGQGYPLSFGTAYIAASPAAAPPGGVVEVWGNCGCGSGGLQAGAPVETVRLWMVGLRRRVVLWHGRRVVVNAGRALVGVSPIDGAAGWRVRVAVPARLGAAYAVAGQVSTTPGSYAVMVTYPGEVAGPHYYTPAPHDGSITRFAIVTPAPHAQP